MFAQEKAEKKRKRKDPMGLSLNKKKKRWRENSDRHHRAHGEMRDWAYGKEKPGRASRAMKKGKQVLEMGEKTTPEERTPQKSEARYSGKKQYEKPPTKKKKKKILA